MFLEECNLFVAIDIIEYTYSVRLNILKNKKTKSMQSIRRIIVNII